MSLFANKSEPKRFTTGNGIEYYIESREAVITGCDSEGDELVIPEYIDGCPVIEIGDSAFAACNRLSGTVEIPRTVKKIDNFAFDMNVRVKEFVMSDGLEKIGESAFSSCENLRRVLLPDTALTLGECVFSDCLRLAEVRLPRALTEIPYGMFISNYSLDSIELPAGIKKIGGSAFPYCIGLEEIHIEAVEIIGEYAFEECVLLQNVYVGANLTEIGKKAFKRCSSLKRFSVAEGVSVGKKAFYLSGVEI